MMLIKLDNVRSDLDELCVHYGLRLTPDMYVKHHCEYQKRYGEILIQINHGAYYYMQSKVEGTFAYHIDTWGADVQAATIVCMKEWRRLCKEAL